MTLDGVTALDLLCSPPSEFFGAHHHPDMTASVTTDRVSLAVYGSERRTLSYSTLYTLST